MPEAWDGKAYIEYENKNYEEALKDFEESLKLNPSNVNSNLGKKNCLKNLGREDEIGPNMDENEINKVDQLLKEEKIDEAANEINSILEKDENNLDAQFLKGYILCKKDDADEAKIIFDKIIDKDKLNYLSLYNCGLVLLNNKRPDEAKEYFKKTLEIQPDFDKALVCMANFDVKEKKI